MSSGTYATAGARPPAGNTDPRESRRAGERGSQSQPQGSARRRRSPRTPNSRGAPHRRPTDGCPLRLTGARRTSLRSAPGSPHPGSCQPPSRRRPLRVSGRRRGGEGRRQRRWRRWGEPVPSVPPRHPAPRTTLARSCGRAARRTMGRTSGNRPPRPAAGLRADTAGRAVAAGPAGGEAGAALRAGGKEGKRREEKGAAGRRPRSPRSAAPLSAAGPASSARCPRAPAPSCPRGRASCCWVSTAALPRAPPRGTEWLWAGGSASSLPLPARPALLSLRAARRRVGAWPKPGEVMWALGALWLFVALRSSLSCGLFSQVFSLILELSVAATLPALSGGLEFPSEENIVQGLRGCLVNLLQNFLPSDLLLIT